MNCTNCTADTTNGLALCAKCQQTLRVALTNAASYFADVERIRPGQRVKSKSKYQSTPPPEVKPAHDPISAVLSEADNAAKTWARVLVDDRPTIGTPPATTVSLLGWLESNVPSIATLAWAGEVTREMHAIERKLQAVLDKSDTGSYAGVCGNELGREVVDGEVQPLICPRDLYRPESATWVRCPECGRTWETSERRRIMLRDARDELAPLRVCARAVVGLTDEVSVEVLTKRITRWVERGQLRDMGVRVVEGRPRRLYRLGEVFDLVLGEITPREARRAIADEQAAAC